MIRIMEVCGTHTRAIAESGIRNTLPQHVRLLSGPGCPVCVTPASYIDTAISLTERGGILATFCDMLKIRGKRGSLAEICPESVTAVYSPEDAVELAKRNSGKKVIFAAAGFETTAPLIAALIKNTYENGPRNLFFLTALKKMEPVLRYVLEKNRPDAMICPGHVAAVAGADLFRFIPDEYGVHAAICGFEQRDVAAGIYYLIKRTEENRPAVLTNLYRGCVKPSGNARARHYMDDVFDTADADWRGIGVIPDSAFVINKKYECLDAKKEFELKEESGGQDCLCGEIIIGLKSPRDCAAFGTHCTPDNPRGPCMISSEGACSVHYNFMSIRKRG